MQLSAPLTLLFCSALLLGPWRAAPLFSALSRPARRTRLRSVGNAAAAGNAAADYVVVGAGASGMAFVDTLLAHAPESVSVLLVDKREAPGGHWHDAYDWVKLHQPARNYGVESVTLEASVAHPQLLASRAEIIAYYRAVFENWRAHGHSVTFVGGATYDFEKAAYRLGADGTRTAVTAGVVVDARHTENDIPLHVPPRFAYDTALDLVPPNELAMRAKEEASKRKYVVLGAGKTGQDTVLYLRKNLGIPSASIVWIMPTDPWITARDPPDPLKQITCMEFLASALEAHTAAGGSTDAATTDVFLQRGFERLELEGKVYRIDPSVRPTKFMDATLDKHELEVLRGCTASIVRGHGRVTSISPLGEMTFADGTVVPLPWAANEGVARTTFVHCTAGAFNFGASAAEDSRPVWSSESRITVQEIFQFPGFCFNGALIAYLQCQGGLSVAQKNSLCEKPPGANQIEPAPYGPVSGLIGSLGEGHPLLVSLRNLRRWYATPGVGEWLHSLRLFSLAMNGYSLNEGKALADRIHADLVAAGVSNEAPAEGDRRP